MYRRTIASENSPNESIQNTQDEIQPSSQQEQSN